MTYALYTGCTPKVAEPELLMSAMAVAGALGWNLVEKREFTCCGGSHLQDYDDGMALLANARNLAYADEEGMDLVTLCNTCQFVLADYRSRLLADGELRDRTNERLAPLKIRFTGKSRPRHYLYVLIEELGYEGIAARVKNPLRGLKVASFYGCHNIRPSAIQAEANGGEDPWKPRSLDKLVAALGGEPVSFTDTNGCCGFHTSLANAKVSGALSGAILSQAHEAGAEALITPCPLCHTNLDAAQYEAKAAIGMGIGFPLPRFIEGFRLTPGFLKRGFSLPVLHFEQLIGIAWGIDPRKLGLGRNIVPARSNPRLRQLLEENARERKAAKRGARRR